MLLSFRGGFLGQLSLEGGDLLLDVAEGGDLQLGVCWPLHRRRGSGCRWWGLLLVLVGELSILVGFRDFDAYHELSLDSTVYLVDDSVLRMIIDESQWSWTIRGECH